MSVFVQFGPNGLPDNPGSPPPALQFPVFAPAGPNAQPPPVMHPDAQFMPQQQPQQLQHPPPVMNLLNVFPPNTPAPATPAR